MRDERFEWDDAKAVANLKKHDISFEAARLGFDDSNPAEKDDPDPDEERRLITGLANSVLLTVCYTERRNRIRIISARRANRNEQDSYFTQDQQDE